MPQPRKDGGSRVEGESRAPGLSQGAEWYLHTTKHVYFDFIFYVIYAKMAELQSNKAYTVSGSFSGACGGNWNIPA